MSEITVKFAGLSGTQQHVASTSAQINSQLGDLKGYLAPLVASWTGDAATRYNEKQRQWDAAIADLNAVLAAVGNAVGQAHDGYQSTENTNAGRF